MCTPVLDVSVSLNSTLVCPAGTATPVTANDKMKYGTRQEPHALASYQHLAPHETLADMGFAVWGTDDAHDWLAASPDGLITCAGGLEQVLRQQGGSSGGQQQQQGEEPAGVSVAEWVRQQTGGHVLARAHAQPLLWMFAWCCPGNHPTHPRYTLPPHTPACI
jgi:hypothetical protein